MPSYHVLMQELPLASLWELVIEKTIIYSFIYDLSEQLLILVSYCCVERKESESESCSVVSESLWPHGLYSPWNSPGQNTGMGSLLQGIFPTQGLNPGLMHCRWILYQLNHKGSSRIVEWVAFPFSRGSSQPRNRTGVSCIAGGFFTNWAVTSTKSQQCATTSMCFVHTSSGLLGGADTGWAQREALSQWFPELHMSSCSLSLLSCSPFWETLLTNLQKHVWRQISNSATPVPDDMRLFLLVCFRTQSDVAMMYHWEDVGGGRREEGREGGREERPERTSIITLELSKNAS